MMLWLRERHPWILSGASVDQVFACVDEYFEQELGDDLQGMGIQASKANDKVLSAFAEIVARYTEHSPLEGERATQILKLFTNFRDVQAAASANVMIDPSWYVSGSYHDGSHHLPAPVIYLETDHGFPADDDLEKFYYVQSETRIDVSNLDNELRGQLGLAADAKVARAAHRLAPLFRVRPEEPTQISKPSSFLFEMPELDLPLWHQQYDSIYSLLRSLIEGFDGNMISADRRELDFLFATLGVKVYSGGRLRDPAKLPEDWSSDAVDPVIRKMMSDKAFATTINALRGSNAD